MGERAKIESIASIRDTACARRWNPRQRGYFQLLGARRVKSIWLNTERSKIFWNSIAEVGNVVKKLNR